MSTTTRLVVLSDALNVLNQKFAPILARFQMPLTTTATTTTTTLTDSTLARGTVGAGAFDGCIIEIAATVGAGPTVDTAGAISGITNGSLSGSTVTCSPAFGAAVQNATSYLIYGPGLSSELLKTKLNEILTHTEAQQLWAPSLVDDADFDANDVTKWPAVGTPGTRAFTTATAPVVPSVTLLGERSLHIVTTTLAHGAASQVVPVTALESLRVSAFVSVVSGSVKVQLWDETNAAELDSVIVSQEVWNHVHFYAPAAATTREVRVRFVSATASSEWYVSAPVILQSSFGRPYPAPVWLESASKIIDAYELPTGYGTSVNRAYVAFSKPMIACERANVMRWDRGVQPLYLEERASTYPIILSVLRGFPTLSTLATVTNCDREYLKWKLCAAVCRVHDPAAARTYNRTAMARAKELGYGLHLRRVAENETVFV